jgi:hypothetical protein
VHGLRQTYHLEIVLILTHKSKLGPFGDSANLDAQVKTHFGRTRSYFEVMRHKSKLGPFGDSANLDAREVHGLRQT